jgi:hypothetical protein
MSGARGHEASDADPRVVVVGLAVLVGVVVVAMALAAAALMVFGRRDPLQASHDVPPPAPRLEVVGGNDLGRVRRIGVARLQGYGWSDRAAATAHIPIARAMQLQAQRGWTTGAGS